MKLTYEEIDSLLRLFGRLAASGVERNDVHEEI